MQVVYHSKGTPPDTRGRTLLMNSSNLKTAAASPYILALFPVTPNIGFSQNLHLRKDKEVEVLVISWCGAVRNLAK